MYSLYVLRSRRNGRFYTGSSENVAIRLKQHNGELPSPGVSTVAGRPWEPVYACEYSSRSAAMAAERYIKRMKSRRWIEKLVSGEYRLPEF